LFDFFLSELDSNITLDIIECSFQYINDIKNKKEAEEAINQLNIRFKEHNLGYEFINGKIIKKDDE
jgi:hypothetical protein